MLNLRGRRLNLGPGVDSGLLSKMVHRDWYNLMYPDVREKKLDPVRHYISAGFSENRSPNPFFVPEFYIAYHHDLHSYGFPAGLHYLKYGCVEGRRPSPFLFYDVAALSAGLPRYSELFDAELANLDTKTAGEDILSSEDRSKAFPFFDVAWYCKKAAEKSVTVPEAMTFNQALMHFFTVGIANAVSPHPLIDLSGMEKYAGFKDRIDFFSKLFQSETETGKYPLSQYVDGEFFVAKHGVRSAHPAICYLYQHEDETLWPHPLFDVEFYKETYGLADDADCLTHFAVKGEADGCWPNAYLDPKRYVGAYSNTFEPDESVLSHYNRMGHMVWFEPSDRFGQRFYHRNNPDVVANETPLLVNFLHDTPGKRRALPQKPFFDDTAKLSVEEIAQEIWNLDFEADMGTPEVDIVIPVYQNLRYTLRCLLSCYRNRDGVAFKAWIADDASPDGSGEWLKNVLLANMKHTEVTINKSNLGFLRSCNAASGHGQADYIYFLNNDTYALDGYLSSLINVLKGDKEAGLVGSKLIYPNGLLQEAGGVIWSDGNCANFGRLDDPAAPDFNYMREVDYISGASIMLRRADWEKVGRFSDDFAPAYYEDTDLAMKIRQIGKRVIYQPASVIVHYEGISSGTDLTTGIKKYQVINGEKFREKWGVQLAANGEKGDLSPDIVSRYTGKRILVIDEELPKPDQDSGSITAFFYLKILVELGFKVTFLPKNLELQGKYAAPLQQMGVRVLFHPYIRSVDEFLKAEGGSYDLFFLSRINSGGVFLHTLKAAFPDTPIIFDTVDLHHLRLRRQYEHTGDVKIAEQAYSQKQLELNAIRQSDLTLLVSEFEKEYLIKEIGSFPVGIIPLIYEEMDHIAPFENRKGFVFVGGFRHTPNLDAVDFLVNQIWPEYLKQGGKSKLYIIGSHMPSEVKEIDLEGVVPVGFVEDLDGFLAGVTATLAPLRYGAGVKGKVGNSMRQGVPVVATKIAAEGMGLKYGMEILVTDLVTEFAAHMISLETDQAKWSLISARGREAANQRFGYKSAKAGLSRIVKTLVD